MVVYICYLMQILNLLFEVNLNNHTVIFVVFIRTNCVVANQRSTFLINLRDIAKR